MISEKKVCDVCSGVIYNYDPRTDRSYSNCEGSTTVTISRPGDASGYFETERIDLCSGCAGDVIKSIYSWLTPREEPKKIDYMNGPCQPAPESK